MERKKLLFLRIHFYYYLTNFCLLVFGMQENALIFANGFTHNIFLKLATIV